MTKSELKSIIMECLEEEGILTEAEEETIFVDEDFDIVKESIIECALEDICYSAEDEIIEEGANFDLTKEMYKFKKEFKAITKEIRENIKLKEFKEAREAVEKLRSKIVEEKKVVKDIKPESTSEKIIGGILGQIAWLYKEYILCYLSLTSTTVGFKIAFGQIDTGDVDLNRLSTMGAFGAGYALSLKALINEFKAFKKIIATYKEAKAENIKLSSYQMKAVSSLNDADMYVRKLGADIKKAEKKFGVVVHREE